MDGDVRVLEWEEGLPAADDLTPLSQPLITPELAAAFGVATEPQRSLLDVQRASQETLESLWRRKALPLAAEVEAPAPAPAPALEEEVDNREEDEELGDSAEGELAEDPSGRAAAAKKPRLLWTPQLHKRFVEVVAYLGIKKAVPKTIMQLMNVEGLTRENVASHLQKYRLYLKRSSLGDADSSPERLFASATKDNSVAVPAVVPYAANPAVVPPPMPVLGGRAHAGVVVPVNGQMRGGPYPMFAAHRPYAVLGQPTRWPGRNNIGSNSLSQRSLPDTVT